MSVDLDRLKQSFDQAVEYALPNVDYLALYACQVVAQNADGSLDLKPARTDWPTQKRVPFRCGIPGVTIQVGVDAQVLLGWQNGDPSAPYAALWLPGSTGDLQAAVVTATTKLSLVAPKVNVGGDPGTDAQVLGTAYRAAEDVLFQALSTLQTAIGTFATAVGGALPAVSPAAATLNTAIGAFITALGSFTSAEAEYLSAIATVS